MRIRAIHALAAAAALVLSPVLASSSDPSSRTDQLIRRTLALRAYTVQTLDLPWSPDGPFELTVKLGDAIYTADLAPDPVDTPDCLMLLDDGSGPMREVAPPASCTVRGTVREIP